MKMTSLPEVFVDGCSMKISRIHCPSHTLKFNIWSSHEYEVLTYPEFIYLWVKLFIFTSESEYTGG
jgi:hypothetical protein